MIRPESYFCSLSRIFRQPIYEAEYLESPRWEQASERKYRANSGSAKQTKGPHVNPPCSLKYISEWSLYGILCLKSSYSIYSHYSLHWLDKIFTDKIATGKRYLLKQCDQNHMLNTAGLEHDSSRPPCPTILKTWQSLKLIFVWKLYS